MARAWVRESMSSWPIGLAVFQKSSRPMSPEAGALLPEPTPPFSWPESQPISSQTMINSHKCQLVNTVRKQKAASQLCRTLPADEVRTSHSDRKIWERAALAFCDRHHAESIPAGMLERRDRATSLDLRKYRRPTLLDQDHLHFGFVHWSDQGADPKSAEVAKPAVMGTSEGQKTPQSGGDDESSAKTCATPRDAGFSNRWGTNAWQPPF